MRWVFSKMVFWKSNLTAIGGVYDSMRNGPSACLYAVLASTPTWRGNNLKWAAQPSISSLKNWLLMKYLGSGCTSYGNTLAVCCARGSGRGPINLWPITSPCASARRDQAQRRLWVVNQSVSLGSDWGEDGQLLEHPNPPLQSVCTPLIVQAPIISLPPVASSTFCFFVHNIIYLDFTFTPLFTRTSLIYRLSVGSSFSPAAPVLSVPNAGWSVLSARAAGREGVTQRKRGMEGKEKEGLEEQVLRCRDNLRITESQSAARK